MTSLKLLLNTLFIFTPALLLAHPGHPGPEEHGNATHLIVGLLVALPALLGFVLWLRHHKLAAGTRPKK